MSRSHVFLVPGFFGFANVGGLVYFSHVRRFLEAELGPDFVLHEVPTRPTAGLRRRALRLLDVIARESGNDGPIHIIGHSTGGVDGRLLLAPDITLGATERAAIVQRCASLVSVTSPHHGAPLARFFGTPVGERFLRSLSAATLFTLRLGGRPAQALARMASALSRTLDPQRQDAPEGLFDQVVQDVLSGFDQQRSAQLQAFFAEVAQDTELASELTPEAMAHFNQRIQRAPHVRYGCVVAQAKPPSPELDPSPSYRLYRVLHRIAAPRQRDPIITPVTHDPHRDALSDAYGAIPPLTANDAIVPLHTQLHGDVIAAVWGDHLDVIGHFRGPTTAPPHVDWLDTLTGFRREAFEQLWTRVADFIRESQRDA